MYSEHKSNTSVWAASCCPQSDAISKMGNDFKLYCCKPANKSGSANDTGAIYGTSTLNQTQCCNTYTLYKTCCGGQGLRWNGSTEENTCCNVSDSGTFRESCCKYANKGVNASWASEKFHKTCCDSNNGYCSCLMRKDKSGLSLDASVGGVNCCDNLKGSYYNDGNWRTKCCLKYINSQSNVTNYGTNCCTGSGTGYVHGGGSSRTATCCNNSTSTLDDWCCDQNKLNQCSCTKRLAKSLSLTSPLACCKATNASYTNAHWISQCCSYSNPGDLSDAKFKESCCKNFGGDAKGGGQTTLCCKDNSGIISDFCCNAGFKTQCSCAKRLLDSSMALDVTAGGVNCCDYLKGSYYNNDSFGDRCCAKYVNSPSSYTNWASYCCTKTRSSYKSNTTWKNTCCPTPASNNTGLSVSNNGTGEYEKVCCIAFDGTFYGHTGGNMSPVCCSTSNKESTFCCSQKGLSYCTCPLQWTYYRATFEKSCCSSLKSYANTGSWQQRCCTGDGHVTGATWVENCCLSGYHDSAANDSDNINCCVRQYNNNIKTRFSTPGQGCCKVLDVSKETGVSAKNSKTYPECIDACNLSSTFGSGNIPYNATSIAKECCNSGYGKAAGNNFYKYCCGMKETSDAWTYSGSSYYASTNGKCCPYRYSGKVWAYVPSYLSNTCPAGGAKNQCSDYYYASSGFYCGYEDACQAWRYQGGSKPSSNFANCCKKYAANLSGSYLSTCCSDATFKSSAEGKPLCCTNTVSSSLKSKACCEYWKGQGLLNTQANIDLCCGVSDFASAYCSYVSYESGAHPDLVLGLKWSVGASFAPGTQSIYTGSITTTSIYGSNDLAQVKIRVWINPDSCTPRNGMCSGQDVESSYTHPQPVGGSIPIYIAKSCTLTSCSGNQWGPWCGVTIKHKSGATKYYENSCNSSATYYSPVMVKEYSSKWVLK